PGRRRQGRAAGGPLLPERRPATLDEGAGTRALGRAASAREGQVTMRGLARFLPDAFTFSVLAVVVFGAFVPCRGEVAYWFASASKVAIGLLFFLQGARLSRRAVLAGILHWRLHLTIFVATFIAFPLLGLALQPVSGRLIAPPLYVGLLFLCTLPSTV